MLLYCPVESKRLAYIAQVLFRTMGEEVQYEITTDASFYVLYEGPKVNYSSAAITENEVWIPPISLLFETGITPQLTETSTWRSFPVFFQSQGSDLPFDIFAASFYLLTRYEEYLPHTPDIYGRYTHENSLAFKENFLKLPLINLWLKEFRKILQLRFPAMSFQPTSFHFLPTYDIDIAWSYLNKGWIRNAGGFIRSVVRGQWSLVNERLKVLLAQQPDPFYSYDWLNKLHAQTDLLPLYFFLTANQNKGYDKNILPNKSSFQNLVKRIADKYSIGIHPSWQSGDDDKLLAQELNALNNITQKSVTRSRQHYIRMKLPDTYRKLIAAGITEDHSMGYGSINGFRASYCLPYPWYDIENEETTSLIIYPFCFMEANSFYEQNYSATEALQELEHYYNVTKEVDGLLITIWHNHFLGTDKMFAGWREVYANFIKQHFIKQN